MYCSRVMIEGCRIRVVAARSRGRPRAQSWAQVSMIMRSLTQPILQFALYPFAPWLFSSLSFTRLLLILALDLHCYTLTYLTTPISGSPDVVFNA